jgi:hypothetical protein
MTMTTSANLADEVLQLKYATEEIEKIKYVNKFDDIIGVSELEEKETIEFIKNTKIENVTFIQNNNFIQENKLGKRFEMIVKDGEIIQYRKDPTITKIVLFFLSLTCLLTIVGMSSQHVYLFLFNNYFV